MPTREGRHFSLVSYEQRNNFFKRSAVCEYSLALEAPLQNLEKRKVSEELIQMHELLQFIVSILFPSLLDVT